MEGRHIATGMITLIKPDRDNVNLPSRPPLLLLECVNQLPVRITGPLEGTLAHEKAEEVRFLDGL